jgi:D-alanyl-D-alanine carboxypeptidase
LVALLGLSAASAALAYRSSPSSWSPATSSTGTLRGQHHGVLGEAVAGTVWPAYGQAAFIKTGQPRIDASPTQRAAPIASVAKVMTTYLVLRDHPLQLGQDGPTITLTDRDVADTDRRAAQDESVVPVVAGEQLTELQALQALQALLLPSANDIAAVLARWDAGSTARFVARMNATTRSLGMTQTRYTNPSGFDDTTVSTAADQVRIVVRAMRRRSQASSPRPAHGSRSPAPCTTPTACSGRTGSSASRPAPTKPPAAASPSVPSARSAASARRSPGSCWARPAMTPSVRV